MLIIGTSGWQYRHWRGRFYPPRLPAREWLPYYAQRFGAVELNNSFYRLPEATSFDHWHSVTPDDFTFAVKASNYLTHYKRLRDPAEPVQRMLDRFTHLGPKLGPVLIQLPPTLPSAPQLLDAVLSLVPRPIRVVLEARHPSWFDDSVAAVLEVHGAALCAADRRSRLQAPLWRTTDFAYVRLHEGTGPESCYGETALGTWLERITECWPEQDTYVMFNNDNTACALRNAVQLAALARRAGLDCSRAPSTWRFEHNRAG